MSDQEMKLKFFALHFGCPVRCYDTAETEGILAGLSVNNKKGVKYCEIKYAENVIVGEFLVHCKLILKPLSEITDEEITEIMQSVFPSEKWHVDYSCDSEVMFYVSGGYKVDFNKENTDWVIRKYDNAGYLPIADFGVVNALRSKGYCLPYMGKDPFEEGWAVPAIINQPQGANQ